jgi:hypothetical protein
MQYGFREETGKIFLFYCQKWVLLQVNSRKYLPGSTPKSPRLLPISNVPSKQAETSPRLNVVSKESINE